VTCQPNGRTEDASSCWAVGVGLAAPASGVLDVKPGACGFGDGADVRVVGGHEMIVAATASPATTMQADITAQAWVRVGGPRRARVV
jgi:hypothetical protein